MARMCMIETRDKCCQITQIYDESCQVTHTIAIRKAHERNKMFKRVHQLQNRALDDWAQDFELTEKYTGNMHMESFSYYFVSTHSVCGCQKRKRIVSNVI